MARMTPAAGTRLAAERTIFFVVGALFFVAALALVLRATTELWALIAGPQAAIVGVATTFLNMMLLVLMLVELAYTVILSLRGTVLAAEPFLLVGLIAVIRRMIVITIGDVNSSTSTAHEGVNGAGGPPLELGILTVIVLALVGSIALLRRQPRDAATPNVNGV
ncbi:MAG: hypothetical protein NVS3B7_13340 [Candidatus Elarobacter sp.]